MSFPNNVKKTQQSEAAASSKDTTKVYEPKPAVKQHIPDNYDHQGTVNIQIIYSTYKCASYNNHYFNLEPSTSTAATKRVHDSLGDEGVSSDDDVNGLVNLKKKPKRTTHSVLKPISTSGLNKVLPNNPLMIANNRADILDLVVPVIDGSHMTDQRKYLY